ncbi:MAG: hypothetical protein UY74_C0075G0010 [Candidatus Kaiserbacteria bacterium GW2011_GWC2_52_8b]|uniref:Uncharacterized protein n=1 Tax=Candidatus Kaiserbacteria bacterium GW2011_GWC2_52_8b TaxID=1618676 RepID=A0A0G1XER6_9BACT|nr:MAG: hypothetical protein UY74_C0075G0010 [Candidatus Kaiserbacteria bacterium GW2011_GWC2_52_8b]
MKIQNNRKGETKSIAGFTPYHFFSKSGKGFTLLLAALVSSIVLAIGAAIYGIAIKELNLSSIGRDSQFAFYAADTAAECTLYNDINKQLFATNSPATFQVSCDGTVLNVSAVQNQSIVSGGSANYTVPGTFTFTPPAQYGTMTVTVNGGGGGGGGGSNGSTNGGNGSSGGSSSFDGTVIGNAGGAAGGGNKNGTTGANGSTGGGNGVTGGGNGGLGGNGGQVTATYTSGLSATVTVVVGVGGGGGNSGGGAAQPGNGGSTGSVLISWTGGTPTWNSTVFSFQSEPNGICAITRFSKTLVSGSLRNLIHSDGSNVPCAATTTSPRALQRSVELSY